MGVVLSTAGAAPSARVRELTRQGIREYQIGDFTRALADISEAYKLSGAAALLFDLGQCHRALEHWKEAEFAYRQYLIEVPRARNREEVTKLVADMRARQEAQAAERRSPRPVHVVSSGPPAEARRPAPAPSIVLVEAPKSPAATAPVVAVTVPKTRPAGSHALAIGLFSGAAVAAGFAITGAVRLAGYEGDLGHAAQTQSFTDYQSMAGRQPNAANWRTASIVLGAVAAVCVLGGVLVW